MAELGRDETAGPGPSDRDLTEDGTGRLGLAFNNPYLQRDKSLCGRALRYQVYPESRQRKFFSCLAPPGSALHKTYTNAAGSMLTCSTVKALSLRSADFLRHAPSRCPIARDDALLAPSRAVDEQAKDSTVCTMPRPPLPVSGSPSLARHRDPRHPSEMRHVPLLVHIGEQCHASSSNSRTIREA